MSGVHKSTLSAEALALLAMAEAAVLLASVMIEVQSLKQCKPITSVSAEDTLQVRAVHGHTRLITAVWPCAGSRQAPSAM